MKVTKWRIGDRDTNVQLSSGSVGVEASSVVDTVTIGDMSTNIGRTSNGYIATETDGTFSKYAQIGDFITNIPLNSSGAMIITADAGEDEKVVVSDIVSDLGKKNGKVKITTGNSFFNFMGPTNSNGFASTVETYSAKIIRLLGSSNIITLQELSETSGSTANNQGLGGDGTYNSITLADDNTHPAGTPAPYFDGVSGYIENAVDGMNSSFNFESFTVLTWVKPSAWTGSHYVLQALKDNSPNNRFWQWHGSVYEYGVTRSSSSWFNSIGPVSADTNWKMITTTVDISGNAVRFYENGVAKGPVPAVAGTDNGTSWTDYFLGVYDSGLTTKYAGHMAYHVLANGVASAATIADLYVMPS
jgi:hypothetical protein